MRKATTNVIADLASFRVADSTFTDTKERLLLALADSIREKGLAQVQITDVVRHAGASRRTFYQCFADKDTAVVALAEMIFTLSNGHVAAAVDPAAPLGVRIDQGVDAFLTFVAADPVLITAVRTELPTIGPLGVHTHLNSVDQFTSLVVGLLRTSATDIADADTLTHVVYMLVTGLDSAFVRAIARGESILDLAPAAKLLFRRALLATR
ncbi:TetR/AcrR family transcriptional regulator [Mycobacterium sp. BMJ-28]